jgi:hypothetical protein
MMFMRENPDFVSVIGAASSMEISMVNSGRSGKSVAVFEADDVAPPCEGCGEPYPIECGESLAAWTEALCYDGRVHTPCPNCEPVMEEDDPDEDRREMMGV